MDDLISVIVPIYNPGMHLRKCLDSLVKQTYGNLEIILIDDGSTDGSDALCNEYVKKDRRLRIIYQKHCGVSHARNVGIANAHGRFYSFIDGDDYLEADAYEYLLNIVEKYHVDIVSYEYFITNSKFETVHQSSEDDYGLKNRRQAQYHMLVKSQFACTRLFPEKVIHGLQFDEAIFRGEDTLFTRLAFEKADTFWFDSRPLYHYVQTEQSAVRGKFNKNQLSIVKLYDVLVPFYQAKYPDFLSEFYEYMANQLIMIYYNMWADKPNYRAERIWLHAVYTRYYHFTATYKGISKRNKMKFRIFKTMPVFFCGLHKMMWREGV